MVPPLPRLSQTRSLNGAGSCSSATRGRNRPGLRRLGWSDDEPFSFPAGVVDPASGYSPADGGQVHLHVWPALPGNSQKGLQRLAFEDQLRPGKPATDALRDRPGFLQLPERIPVTFYRQLERKLASVARRPRRVGGRDREIEWQGRKQGSQRSQMEEPHQGGVPLSRCARNLSQWHESKHFCGEFIFNGDSERNWFNLFEFGVVEVLRVRTEMMSKLVRILMCFISHRHVTPVSTSVRSLPRPRCPILSRWMWFVSSVHLSTPQHKRIYVKSLKFASLGVIFYLTLSPSKVCEFIPPLS